MKQFLEELRTFIPKKNEQDFLDVIRPIKNISPFHVSAIMQMWLIDKGYLDFSEAIELQKKYGNINKNLFEMPETTFGIKWGQNHIFDMDKRFIHSGCDHHDLILEQIKVEVKATRAVRKGKGTLLTRALASNTNESFYMNFNHIFLDEADVYVLIAVWSNEIWYWAIPKLDIIAYLHKYQNEFQLPLTQKTIKLIEPFKCRADNLVENILKEIK